MRTNKLPWVAVAVGLALLAVIAGGVGYLAWNASQDRAARAAHVEFVALCAERDREVGEVVNTHIRLLGEAERGGRVVPDDLGLFLDQNPDLKRLHAAGVAARDRANDLRSRWLGRWNSLGLPSAECE